MKEMCSGSEAGSYLRLTDFLSLVQADEFARAIYDKDYVISELQMRILALEGA